MSEKLPIVLSLLASRGLRLPPNTTHRTFIPLLHSACLTAGEAKRRAAVRLSLEASSGNRMLALFYADLLNGFAKVGHKPSQEFIHHVDADLAAAGWVLAWEDAKGKWEVKRPGGDAVQMSAGPKHAPAGGVTINGVFYRGGLFIPGAVVEQASPEVKAKLDAAGQDRRTHRQARGSVDREGLKGKLAPHADKHAFDKRQMGNVKRAYAAFRRHHGDLILHRLHEIHDEVSKALAGIPAEQEGGMRRFFERRLAALGHIAGLAEKDGITGEVKEADAKAARDKMGPPKAKPAAKTTNKTAGKPAQAPSLVSEVIRRGGISRAAFGRDWNVSEDFVQSGLLGILKPGGVGLDDMAEQLQRAGLIQVPAHRNPDDYLMELLHTKAVSLHHDYTEELAKSEAAYHEELSRAREQGLESGDVEEAARRGEEEGRRAGEEGPLDEGPGELAGEEAAGEVGDFAFGANAPAEDAAPAPAPAPVTPPVAPAITSGAHLTHPPLATARLRALAKVYPAGDPHGELFARAAAGEHPADVAADLAGKGHDAAMLKASAETARRIVEAEGGSLDRKATPAAVPPAESSKSVPEPELPKPSPAAPTLAETFASWDAGARGLTHQDYFAHHPADTSDKAKARRRSGALADLDAIPEGELGYAGGWPVRSLDGGSYRLDTGDSVDVGDARLIADRIAARNEQTVNMEGRRYREALDRVKDWKEPDPFMQPDESEADGRAFAALPHGARVVSLEPHSYGRVGEVVRDEAGRNRVRLDGDPGLSQVGLVEPLDAKQSWRGQKPAGTKAKQAGLFDAPAPTPTPSAAEPNPDPAPNPEPPPAVAAAETPREAASRVSKQQLEDQSEYAFARASAVPNAGEDLAASARHIRNAWKGLEEAEKDGSAEEMVTRDRLFKNEPIDLHGAADKHPMTALVMRLALNKFPAAPVDSTGRDIKPEHRAAARGLYYAAFKEIKAKAEHLAANEPDITKAVDELQAVVRAHMNTVRSQTVESMGGKIDPETRRVLGNGFAVMSNKLMERGPTGVKGQANDFHRRATQAYGEGYLSAHAEKVAGHVKDILEGDSFNKTFGTVGKKGKEFNPADLYVKHAERKGGPVVNASTVKAGTDYMLNNFKMRGLQYGNSVTDEEREHHLQKAAESFADMADVLGLPEEAVSMGGKLGIAFGARGKGSALAHYEPGMKVINLTRKSGVGSLAHEWGHFFDHMIAGGGNTSHTGGGPTSGAAIGGYMSTDHRRTGRFTHQAVEKIERTPLHHAYGQWASAVESSGFRKRLSRALSQWRREKGMSDGKVMYWRSDPEVFARTFERYIQHKLAEQGRLNTYLSGVGSATHWSKEGMKAPGSEFWPTDEEVKAMAPAFDAIFAAYRQQKHPGHKPASAATPAPAAGAATPTPKAPAGGGRTPDHADYGVSDLQADLRSAGVDTTQAAATWPTADPLGIVKVKVPAAKEEAARPAIREAVAAHVKANAFTRPTIPDLYQSVGAKHGLTVRQFQAVLARTPGVRLAPYTLAFQTLPAGHHRFLTPLDREFKYYVMPA